MQHLNNVFAQPLLAAAVASATATLGSPAASAAGEVVTVTTVQDVVDFQGAQQVGDLPGPDGIVSFREAITATNNTPGAQTIAFAIPQSEYWLMDDRAILELEDGAFSINDNETTVDFTTQTDAAGDTNPNGWEVGIYGLEPNAWGASAIYVNGDNCVIKGLDRVMQRGYGVQVTGNDNRVISCTISGPLYAGVKVQGNVGDPAMNNVVGGTLPGEGNVLSAGNAGVRVDGPTDGTVVIGNTLVGSPFAGVQVRGAYCCPDYTPFNTRVGGPTPAERNWIADNGSFGEEGFPLGAQVDVEWAVGTTVEGNYIGTTEAGDARFPNAHGTAGVAVRESDDTIIRGNLISGIRKEGVNHHAGEVFGSAVSIYGPNTGVVIQGNLIGTDSTGQEPVLNYFGITFSWFQGYPSGGLIGGPAPGDANTIAFNERTGIAIGSGASGVTIQSNSIHANGLLGIDLLTSSGQAGPSPNDPGDADTGANNLQNFPVLDSAAVAGSSMTIEGTLNSTPNAAFTLQFFASGACDPSGFGEGAELLGETDVMTDGSGNAAFVADVSAGSSGQVVTATATRIASGDTSEFSACITADVQSIPGDIDGDGVVGILDFLALLAAWGPCDGCPEDLDGDGVVGILDLLLLLGNWS